MIVEVQGWKANLKFSSSHMIPGHPRCGSLHGHTYFLNVRIHGDIGADGFVVDFGELKPLLRDICDSLDHRVLIPARNRKLKISGKEELDILSGKKHYVFPSSDVVILDLEFTTVEHLAGHIAGLIAKGLKKHKNIERMEVGLDEGWGQGVWLERKL